MLFCVYRLVSLVDKPRAQSCNTAPRDIGGRAHVNAPEFFHGVKSDHFLQQLIPIVTLKEWMLASDKNGW